MKDDKALQRDVLDELQWEPSVDAAAIGVTARDGVVTLTGGVPSYAEKVRAEDAAKRVHGVRAVANDLDVRLPARGKRTDSDIAEAAVNALHWSTTVPDERIKVAVARGWVTLDGEVDWDYQRAAAYQAVHHLAGVTGVTNALWVKPSTSATEVGARIEAAFRRSAELDAHQVHVETHDGTVTLTGEVHSWAERQVAEQTAWSAPGVSRVDDHLKITPRDTE